MCVCLFVCVERNLQMFNSALLGSSPLFQIKTILSAPLIVLHPKSNEVYKLIMQCVRDCVESTKVIFLLSSAV